MSDLFRSEAGDDDDEGGEDEEEEDGDDEINAPARTPRSSSNARLRDIKQQVTGRGKQTWQLRHCCYFRKVVLPQPVKKSHISSFSGQD